jgi:multimeric flavodoxin WrbA
MKITLLNGSPRKNGNTNTILSIIIERLNKEIFEPQLINISDYKINYCLGCHECEKTKKCIQTDDMEIIYNSLKNVDLICIASPSYWGYTTGQLKVFFDRSTPYCNTIDGKSIFPKGKKGIAISLRAGSKINESLEIIKSIEHYYSHLEITPIKNISFENIQSKSDINSSIRTQEKINKFVFELNKWGENAYNN